MAGPFEACGEELCQTDQRRKRARRATRQPLVPLSLPDGTPAVCSTGTLCGAAKLPPPPYPSPPPPLPFPLPTAPPCLSAPRPHPPSPPSPPPPLPPPLDTAFAPPTPLPTLFPLPAPLLNFPPPPATPPPPAPLPSASLPSPASLGVRGENPVA
ncbi:unnamed protein product [Closterium sp. NIES-54]